MITIRINDRPINLTKNSTLSQVLEQLVNGPKTEPELNQQGFVIALNQNFVPRSQYPTTLLNDNDHIELLSPMAGG